MEIMEKEEIETKKIENKIRTFEDLKVYQMAREFSRKVGMLIKKLPTEEKFNLVSQMRRAKLSVTNNIAEGYGRYHFQENMQFCRQARGSVYELIDDFNECLDCGYIGAAECAEYKKEAYQLVKMLNAYITKTKQMKQAYISQEENSK